jgi:hypothetical protein
VLCVGEQGAGLWFWENVVWKRKQENGKKKVCGNWNNLKMS